MIIIPNDVNDNKHDDVRKRIDDLYEYVRYMREQINFYGSVKEKQEENNG